MGGVCYQDCPVGTTRFINTNICIACEAGCQNCDSVDPEQCLVCNPPLKVHNGTCVAGCPKGYIENKTKTACVARTLDDLKKVYFPFICAWLISCLIIVFGKYKKKQSFVDTRVNNKQSTITVIICALSPLQWLALIAQIVFAFLYGVKLHFYLALIVFALFCILNISFCIYFDQSFAKKELTREKQLTISKWPPEKRKELDLNKYKVAKDAKFFKYREGHGFIFCLISTLTCLVTFKFNKMFYSHFYSFGMFKATWTNEKQYRKALTWFTMVHMIVIDLVLIVIGIAGLSGIGILQNQLWITFVETVVLSIIDIILSAYELYKLKEILDYTSEPKQNNRRAKVSSGADDGWGEGKTPGGLAGFYDEIDHESRIEMIHGLITRVQANKNLFLNNKLDELLNMFGDRRCKSMIELGTGWDKEEDPRKIITIPMSPNLLLDKYDRDFHFTKEDAYGVFDDNCYAEAKVRDPGVATGVQGDQEQQDFNQALQRKQAEFLNRVDSDEDEVANRKHKSGKRRGRKNKYYAQIDNEDDVDAAGGAEGSGGDLSEEEETNE